MEIMMIIIMLGVVLIDAKLWKLVLEQGRHNKAMEELLSAIRDRMPPTGQSSLSPGHMAYPSVAADRSRD